MTMQRPTFYIACAVGLLALGGCALPAANGGRDGVRQLVQQRGGPATPVPAALDQHVASLLAQPLTADNAVNIAVLNNRSLQAGYAELGIAQSDLLQAGRLPNPVISFARIKSRTGMELERRVMLPIMGILTMPITRAIEQRNFEQAQMRTAAEVLRVADETRRAWYGAVAAQQGAVYMEQVQSAAEASAELARRMQQAGNWSALQQAREQSFLADAVGQLARARQTSVTEREKLIRLMGLTGEQTRFSLPDRLPDLPAAPRQVQDAEADAMANRLDILMAQKELAGLSKSLALTRATRFINLLDVSYLNNTGGHVPRATGYEIELEIPIFDVGNGRLNRAEGLYMQAVQRAAAGAVDARSQVREAYAGYQSAYQIARHHRDEIVPLKKRISDEQLLRYNGMLISVFELLADSREQVASVNASIEAQRDFWIADSALQAAMTGAAAQH